MTPLELNDILFLLATIAFAVIGFSSARKHKSATEYFHHADLEKNVVSLTATTLTLGTGLVYLIAGAEHNGLLMLLVPVAVGAGFFLQAWVLGRLGDSPLRTQKNILGAIDKVISEQRGKPSLFGKITSASLVSVFILVLAFEIFASAKVIAPMLFKSANTSAEVWMSIIIFCITIFYTLLGGVTAVFSVDKIQVPLIILFLPTLLFIGIPDLVHPIAIADRLVGTLKLNSSAVIATLIACIGAVATQLYSILNWGAVSHVAVKHQQKLLRRVGTVSSIIFILWVLIGLLHPTSPENSTWPDLMQHLAAYTHGTTIMAYLVSGILVLGMASILLTTTDAVVISVIMFWYDNVLGGDSKSGEQDVTEVRKIRRIGAAAFVLCFAVLIIINYFQPDPFYLLLSMAGGVTVFAPMIATATYLGKEPLRLRVFSNSVVYAYFWVFLASGVADVILLSRKSSWVSYVGALAFIFSCIFSAILLVRSRTMLLTRSGSS